MQASKPGVKTLETCTVKGNRVYWWEVGKTNSGQFKGIEMAGNSVWFMSMRHNSGSVFLVFESPVFIFDMKDIAI